MVRNVYLYGFLKENFGEVHRLDIMSVGEAMLAIGTQFQNFRDMIKDKSFYVLKGEDLDDCEDLGCENINLVMQQTKGDFHIVPVAEGHGGGSRGLWTAVIGVVLIAASWYIGGAAGWGTTLGTFAKAGIGIGVSLTLTGISQMLSPIPDMTDSYSEREKERPSFLFDGPINRTEQGGPVSIIYGEFIVGSVTIGGAIDVEEYKYE